MEPEENLKLAYITNMNQLIGTIRCAVGVLTQPSGINNQNMTPGAQKYPGIPGIILFH